MRKYNFTFQQSLKHLLLIAVVITMLTPVVYAKKPTTLQSISNSVVVDSTGKTVGNVNTLLVGNEAVVVFNIDGYTVTLTFTHSNILGSCGQGGGLAAGPFFTSGDCSGTPLICSQPDAVLPSSTVSAPALGIPGNAVYVSNGTPINFSIPFSGSLLFPDGSCISNTLIGTYVPAVKVIDLTTVFTPPFSVQVGK